MNAKQNGAQAKCNHGYKSRRPGRLRSLVTRADFVDTPDETMLALAHIKNNESLSWRQLAEEYFPDFSHAFVRKVALGYAKSDAISIALGIMSKPPEVEEVPVCAQCGELHEQKTTCPHELQRARRNRPKIYTLAFRFRSREDFEKARAAVDAGGDRVSWLLSKVDKEIQDGP